MVGIALRANGSLKLNAGESIVRGWWRGYSQIHGVNFQESFAQDVPDFIDYVAYLEYKGKFCQH